MSEHNDRLFVRFYIDASRSGLMADLGAERWHTLCTLATFMDEKGECYPSQELLAHRMGVSIVSANRRLKKLCEYQRNNIPVVKRKIIRDPKTKRCIRTIYRLTGIAPFSIFSKDLFKVELN
ncbi:helix-turn-helix domain-containing protein [Melghirimyces algeriensis]|uniref:Helix-turn-helix domain-containing protein n=1 Tax=Melghirimyces algeriensis TaxID=910412 RepID=A0A521F7W5_9BACL|nr:helix-turn-helix domain-containing protein [Melghirimyces algeriensis]SMO92253.1 Helix-turn-helix domain-containing protein [Melghirimyces algeriensis]